MDKIKVELLDYTSLNKIVQIACLVTRGANKFSTPEELIKNINDNPWSQKKINDTLKLPHSKIARFTDFTYLITGSSRRFLAQLTTHHTGISIMSGSLQYSDHSKQHLEDMFCVPYEILATDNSELFTRSQSEIMDFYDKNIEYGYNRDTAGYTAPQSLRNILLVKVNLEELRYIGNQRLCKRNTDETSYVFGLMIEQAIAAAGLPDKMFMPSCYNGKCKEGKYSCGEPIICDTITDYLNDRFNIIRK